MIIFENPGLIDLRTISTFGISVKESKSPIGMFGTGLKYALAVLLRTGHKVTIVRGNDTYVVTVREQDVRGKEFSMLYLNDQPLPFTTHLGHTWKVWMAYRELYSNALDEGGHVYKDQGIVVEPLSDKTYICVHGADIEAVHYERHKYFLSGTPIYSGINAEVYEGRSDCVYYRGIRAMELEHPSLFTYNLISEHELTEDRTIKSEWYVKTEIAQQWQASEHAAVREVLLAPDGTYERELTFYAHFITSEAFLQYCERHASDLARLNPSAAMVFEKKRPATTFVSKTLNDADTAMLEGALRSLRAAGVELKHPVVVVEHLGNGVLGAVRNDTILISYECFMRGDRTLIGTIYEEHVHLVYGHDDCSRAMQNHLLDRLVAAWSTIFMNEVK